MVGVFASRRAAEIALAVAATLLTLLCAEGVVRWLGAAEPRPTGYAPVNTARSTKQRLNSRGFRDHERNETKPAGTRRVLVLGDSFTWGHGVELEDTYPRRLERVLERRQGTPWEVVSLALPGMNTVDQAVQLGEIGMAYAPDVVLLGYVLNDSEDAQAAETRRAAEWAEPGSLGVLDHSALARLVQRRIWATLENRRRVAGYRSMYAAEASGWQAAQRALTEMGRLCHERNVPFVAVIFPLFGNPLDQRYPFTGLHEEVARAAEVSGARVVDLLPTYRGLRSEILVVDGVDDEHPNEVAHRLAAAAIRPVIEELLPPPTPNPPGETEP
jgi:hypothetical protein